MVRMAVLCVLASLCEKWFRNDGMVLHMTVQNEGRGVQNGCLGGLCSVITGIGNGCDRAQPSICKTVLDRTVSATAGEKSGKCKTWNSLTQRRGENNQSADYGGYSRDNPLTTGFISVTSVHSVVKTGCSLCLANYRVSPATAGCLCG